MPLREALTQHEVSTTYERGWSKLSNGELLDAAEREGFALMITTTRTFDTNRTSDIDVLQLLSCRRQAGQAEERMAAYLKELGYD